MTTKFLLTVLSLFLCANIFAQTSAFKSGKIQLNDGEQLSGYISLVDQSSISFKLTKSTDFQKYFIAEEVLSFDYDLKQYKSLRYNGSKFFALELEQGNINLYENKFSKNQDERYFIEIDKKIIKLSSSNYYDIFKEHIGDLSLFQKYEKDMFVVAFSFGQDDLRYLINHYNQQFIPIIKELPNSYTTDNRTKGKIIYERKMAETNSSSEIPNSARNELVLKSEVLYNQIQEALKEENWEKINVALNLLKPLGEEVEAFDNNQLYHQLLDLAKEKKTTEFKKTLISFVSKGLHSLIKIANEQNDIVVRKIIIRQAFVEFLEIRATLQKTDANLTQQIFNQFKMVFAKAKINEQFKVETKKMINFFNSIIRKVIAQ